LNPHNILTARNTCRQVQWIRPTPV